MKPRDIKKINWKVCLLWDSKPEHTCSTDENLEEAVLRVINNYNVEYRNASDEEFNSWLDTKHTSVRREIRAGDMVRIRRLKRDKKDEYLTDCAFLYDGRMCSLVRGIKLEAEETIIKLFEDIEEREDPETVGDFVKAKKEEYPELVILKVARYGEIERRGRVAKFE